MRTVLTASVQPVTPTSTPQFETSHLRRAASIVGVQGSAWSELPLAGSAVEVTVVGLAVSAFRCVRTVRVAIGLP
jgi:hypothetical protein